MLLSSVMACIGMFGDREGKTSELVAGKENWSQEVVFREETSDREIQSQATMRRARRCLLSNETKDGCHGAVFGHRFLTSIPIFYINLDRTERDSSFRKR